MSPATRRWLDDTRDFIVRTATPRSQVDVNSVRKFVEVGVIPPPPNPQDVKSVLRPAEFRKVGSIVVEDNGYTSSKFIRSYRVDFHRLYQKLALVKAQGPKTKKFFAAANAW